MNKTVLIVAAVAILGLSGWGYKTKMADAPKPAQTVSSTTEKKPQSLEFSSSDLWVVAPGEVNRSIPLTGSLKAVNQALLKAKIPGELKSFVLREGMSVKAGQVIAYIDAIDAKSRIAEREAQLRSSIAQVEQAKRVVESNKALLEKNFISQNAFDLTKSNYDVAIAARDAIAQQLVQSKKVLTDTQIISPINGVISERFVQPGEKLAIDARVVSVIDLSKMEIEAPVPSSDITNITVGQTVSLQVEGVKGEQIGKITRIAPTTQAGTRSIPVYITLENKNPLIRGGMFAQGSLAVEARKNVIVIPLAALREAAGRNFVYVINNGVIAEREITIGLRDDRASAANGSSGVAEITQGLRTGDEIVAVNLGPLAVGATVVKKASPQQTQPTQKNAGNS
jgi:membrane fusion protein, multidrug efflux system